MELNKAMEKIINKPRHVPAGWPQQMSGSVEVGFIAKSSISIYW